MPYLILAIAVLVGLGLVAHGLSGIDLRALARTLKWSGMAMTGGLVGYLLATRQFEWAISAAAVALPLILRWGKWSRPSPGGRTRTAGGGRRRSSNVETAFLRMSLDHASGTLDGMVIAGSFAGRKLSELDEAELMALLRECRVGDDQSASVLEAYLDRTRGPDWRSASAGEAGGGGGGAARASSAMSREEAYQVLGLEPGASPEAVKAAHHRLMRHCHPDMGGSDYLAARLNEAKDVLLRG